MNEFAKGGIVSRPGPGADDTVPADVEPLGYMLPLRTLGAADYECGFCERGQCARCTDRRCTCCNGNPE